MGFATSESERERENFIELNQIDVYMKTNNCLTVVEKQRTKLMQHLRAHPRARKTITKGAAKDINAM